MQYRIIPLSLPIQSFHILAPLAPFPQDWGLSLPPKHFLANFFRNFFQSAKATFCCIFGAKNYVFLGRTFFYFFGAKNYGGEYFGCFGNRGGWSLFARSPHINRHILTQGTSGVLQHSTRSKEHRIRAKRGKSKHLFARFCLTPENLETERCENLIYF